MTARGMGELGARLFREAANLSAFQAGLPLPCPGADLVADNIRLTHQIEQAEAELADLGCPFDYAECRGRCICGGRRRECGS